MLDPGSMYEIQSGEYKHKVLIIIEKKPSGGLYCMMYPEFKIFVVYEDDFRDKNLLEFVEKLPDNVLQTFVTKFHLLREIEK